MIRKAIKTIKPQNISQKSVCSMRHISWDSLLKMGHYPRAQLWKKPLSPKKKLWKLEESFGLSPIYVTLVRIGKVHWFHHDLAKPFSADLSHFPSHPMVGHRGMMIMSGTIFLNHPTISQNVSFSSYLPYFWSVLIDCDWKIHRSNGWMAKWTIYKTKWFLL